MYAPALSRRDTHHSWTLGMQQPQKRLSGLGLACVCTPALTAHSTEFYTVLHELPLAEEKRRKQKHIAYTPSLTLHSSARVRTLVIYMRRDLSNIACVLCAAPVANRTPRGDEHREVLTEAGHLRILG